MAPVAEAAMEATAAMAAGVWAAVVEDTIRSKTAPTARKCRTISKRPGQLFEVKKLPIEQIYAQIEEELRNQYGLGYTPDRP
jgi:hypothetical protein